LNITISILAEVRQEDGFAASVAQGFSPARFVFNEVPT